MGSQFKLKLKNTAGKLPSWTMAEDGNKFISIFLFTNEALLERFLCLYIAFWIQTETILS